MIKITSFIVAILAQLSLPTFSLSANVETRFGPIIYDTKEQIVAYGRSIRPLLSPAYRRLEPPFEVIVSRHEHLFETVCSNLDIRLDGQKTNVRIVSSLKELRSAYRHFVPDIYLPVTAFYSHADKTIWYAVESLSREQILHETAHAVLDHYFFQAIPKKVDEIIARSVEQSD